MSTIDIRLDGRSTGKVLVDGVDHAKYATSVDVRARVGRPPEVTIDYMAEVAAILDGKPTHFVAVGPFTGKGATLRDAVAEVLAAIEADAA